MRWMVVVGVVLAGCATAKETYTPDGRQGYSIQCSGLVLSWANCYEKAGAICVARGYDIISRSDERGAIATTTYAGTTVTRTMLVACK